LLLDRIDEIPVTVFRAGEATGDPLYPFIGKGGKIVVPLSPWERVRVRESLSSTP